MSSRGEKGLQLQLKAQDCIGMFATCYQYGQGVVWEPLGVVSCFQVCFAVSFSLPQAWGNVMKWCIAARVSVDVNIGSNPHKCSSLTRSQASTATEMGGTHLGHCLRLTLLLPISMLTCFLALSFHRCQHAYTRTHNQKCQPDLRVLLCLCLSQLDQIALCGNRWNALCL